MGPPPREPSDRRWRLFVDTGGTFTDCLGIDPGGRVRRVKVLSSGRLRATVAAVDSPTRVRLDAEWVRTPGFAPGASLSHGGEHADSPAARILTLDALGWAELDTPLRALAAHVPVEVSTGEEAPIIGARVLTGTPAGASLPPMEMRLATTRGTNALLERRGAAVAFFVTEGFGDLLLIGDQTRPDLFSLTVRRPPPLHAAAIEVRERLDAQGRVVAGLDLAKLREDARAAFASGIRVAAVALAHAWTNPAHERAVGQALLAIGFEHVSLSSELGASIGLLARAETAVVNAFLAPVIEQYLDGVEAPMAPGSALRVMTSAGGLADRARFEPKDSLLSGPAGGVIGAAEAGRSAGFDRVISFDMGGTSTDCARCEGRPERVYQTRVGDARIVAPSVAVETVAAGGGSICAIEHTELRVGPESAGADPGPACYGRGGPLTLTDCNLLLGRLDPSRFAVPLDRASAERRAAEALAHAGPTLTLEQMLAGFIAVADQRMAAAVRRITLRRGHDPAEHALVAFGGAGPQHACAIAEALGIDAVVVPPDAGLLSARGLAAAELERIAQRQVLRPLLEVEPELPRILGELSREAGAALGARADETGVSTHRSVELRFAGEADLIELEATETVSLARAFARRYADAFGHAPDRPIELVTARVSARRASPPFPGAPEPTADAEATPRSARLYASGRWIEAPVRERSSLAQGGVVSGPALLTEAHSTILVEHGWIARAAADGAIVMERVSRPAQAAPRPAAVEVELATGKLGAIALEMGERLRRTAISTNVKDRLDFSCAILDGEGRLVVNAPHVPVHLGSMGVCVRAVRDALGPALGGTVVTNHPAFGGSHLPDVTVIHPVLDASGAPIAYAACRAHHAEIGGIAPGSMAPAATCLAEEGVVIPPTVIGGPGRIDWDAARRLFTRGEYPSRAPDTNARDLAAAVHAAWAGANALRALADGIGARAFAHLGDVIRERAAARVRAALAAREGGAFEHEERLDDGTPLRVRITVERGRAAFDFTGSGAVHARCLNATPAIVTSAVVYVLRLLIDEPLPLNEGLLGPVEIVIPPGMLNPTFPPDPRRCPAVAGGNVEISQLLVESMLSALGLCAQSQGTMNNVVFGDARFGFYETLGGGSGASHAAPGAYAIHTHMTNTSLSDLEIVEKLLPVRIVRCAIRRGSGGQGVHPGGDGMVREYEFLRDVQASVLAERRRRPPRGLTGGNQGLPGNQLLVDADGAILAQPFTAGTIRAGQRLRVLTPGGGGFGPSPSPERH